MWVFAPDAFISVVQLRNDPDKLLLRFRTESDALNLAHDLGGKVVKKPKGDYRWQLVAGREAFANWVWEWLMSIEYTTNVKGNIDQGDSHRHDVLLDVWSAMMRLQTGRKKYTETLGFPSRSPLSSLTMDKHGRS